MTERRCPYCRSLCDDHTSLGLGMKIYFMPEPGALSVCAYCAEVSVFTEDLQLRRAGFEDLVALTSLEHWVLKTAQLCAREMPLFGKRNHV